MKELVVLLLGAKAHDLLDPGPVVPGAVEKHDLSGGRQMCDVAVEIPLAAFGLGRFGQRNHSARRAD